MDGPSFSARKTIIPVEQGGALNMRIRFQIPHSSEASGKYCRGLCDKSGQLTRS